MAQDEPTKKPSLPGLRPPDLKAAAPAPPIPPIKADPPLAPAPPSVRPEKISLRIRPDDDPAEQAGQPPPAGTRIIAALIDFLIAGGIYGLLVVAVPGSLAWLVAAAYLVFRDSLPFLGCQSIGKRVMKLRALTRTDEPLGGEWKTALIRNAIMVVPPVAVIELVVLLTREDTAQAGSRLGDEWAGTKVIIDHPPTAESPDDGDPAEE
jgi:uncharacterized RDD family membrane protein YckC